MREEASERTRTVDLLITSQLLYQLSYTGLQKVSNCSSMQAFVNKLKVHFVEKMHFLILLGDIYFCYLLWDSIFWKKWSVKDIGKIINFIEIAKFVGW